MIAAIVLKRQFIRNKAARSSYDRIIPYTPLTIIMIYGVKFEARIPEIECRMYKRTETFRWFGCKHEKGDGIEVISNRLNFLVLFYGSRERMKLLSGYGAKIFFISQNTKPRKWCVSLRGQRCDLCSPF